MPTKKPRFTLTLDEATNAAVEDLADARHVSKATVVRDFLEPAVPVLHRIAAIMRHAEKVQGAAAEDFATSLARTEDFVTALLPGLMAEFEKAEGKALQGTEEAPVGGVSGGPGARATGASDGAQQDPRTLTGGSESHKPLKNNKPEKRAPGHDFSPRKAS